jgi:co-chaperonin GroES (HSP10)
MRPTKDRVFAVEREAFDRSVRGAGIIAPTNYSMTGERDYDCPFIGRVVAVGSMPEAPDGSLVFEVGDHVVLNLFNVGHRLMLAGRPTYSIHAHGIGGVIDPETVTVRPVQHYVLVKPNLERAKRVVTGGSLVLLADSVVQSDDLGSRGLHCEYGEVVAVGSGQWLQDGWTEAECEPGDLICFDASHSTIPLTLRGEKFALVPVGNIIGQVSPEEEDAWIDKVLRERATEARERAEAEAGTHTVGERESVFQSPKL